jgi:hypothetical protein
MVVDKIVYATIVKRRFDAREIFRTLASLRSARVLTYISLASKQRMFYNRCINYYYATIVKPSLFRHEWDVTWAERSEASVLNISRVSKRRFTSVAYSIISATIEIKVL